MQEKLRRRVASVDIKILNAPRSGKKCLVLDIDYTLFDLGSTAERPEELGRPYLHHFLKSAYEHYDIVIWSATSMKWIEVKMQQLGVLNNPDYKITFMLDHKAMITVQTEKYGKLSSLLSHCTCTCCTHCLLTFNIPGCAIQKAIYRLLKPGMPIASTPQIMNSNNTLPASSLC